MADNLDVHQRNTLVHRTQFYDSGHFVRDEAGFSQRAEVWTGSEFEIPKFEPTDSTNNCHHQLVSLILKNPHWKDYFRRSVLSESLNQQSNPEFTFDELETAEKSLPRFSNVTKLSWYIFNGKCIEKFQADNTNRYQFDWPISTDHGKSVNSKIFGINPKVMDENLAQVRAHQIVNEKNEVHKPYRQLSHRLSKQPATIPSIRTRHDPSVIATSLIQDAVVLDHLDNAVKLTPAADLMKIIILGSPLKEVFKKTVLMVIVAEMSYFPAREDIKTIPIEMVLKNMEQQLEDKTIRQFVSTVILGASPAMLDGFAWRSCYISRDKNRVLENIKQLQRQLFELRVGPSMEDIQKDVNNLFQSLVKQYPPLKVALESIYNKAAQMITDDRQFDQAATVLSDCLYTINYEAKLLASRHVWLLADATLYRKLQRILKDKLTVPEIPITTIMASQASLVAVETIMTEASKFMQPSIIKELYNPQVFLSTNPTVQAIANQQQEWNPIRPEMAVTVGDVTPQKATELFCTLNFAQADAKRQALALNESGKNC